MPLSNSPGNGYSPNFHPRPRPDPRVLTLCMQGARVPVSSPGTRVPGHCSRSIILYKRQSGHATSWLCLPTRSRRSVLCLCPYLKELLPQASCSACRLASVPWTRIVNALYRFISMCRIWIDVPQWCSVRARPSASPPT